MGRGEKWRCSNERMIPGLFSFHPLFPTSPLYTAGRLHVCLLPMFFLEHTLNQMPIFYFAVHIPVYTLCSECMRAAKRKLQELSHQLRKLKETPANGTEAGLWPWVLQGGNFWHSIQTFRVLLGRQGENEWPCSCDC